jgi:hypothetical protein
MDERNLSQLPLAQCLFAVNPFLRPAELFQVICAGLTVEEAKGTPDYWA